MAGLYQKRLLMRLLVLGVLTFCLGILSRHGDGLSATGTAPPSLPVQKQAPIVTAQTQAGAPLVITSARAVSPDPQNVEIAFSLANVSNKSIRAYAIKQEVEAGGEQASSLSLYNLDLTASQLQPNQSTTDFDTYQAVSEKEHHVTLSVDYVEFSDGTKWGADSGKSAERVAGQRAAAYLLSKRLLRILNTGNAGDVLGALEKGAANIEPPRSTSDAWNEGFRLSSSMVATQLKRAQQKGGSAQVERELRQLAERFKGVN